MNNGTITIPVSRYEELVQRSACLGALEAAGVGNWEGYSDAMRSLEDEDE